MAHFAKVNSDNVVEQVVVVPDEQEDRGNEYLNEIGLEGTWIQTSYNHNIRKMFAGISCVYVPTKDIFVNPKPYDSWTLDEELEDWVAPKPYPQDSGTYFWNETTQEWELLVVQAELLEVTDGND